MHPRDGVVVVVNVCDCLHQKVAGKVGWPEDWWPMLVFLGTKIKVRQWGFLNFNPVTGKRGRSRIVQSYRLMICPSHLEHMAR
jgi:hypothetical protein